MALIRILALDPAGYEPHSLHTEDRTWQETNCYTDVWIELLHSLGLDPIPALAFLLATDFDGDQWRFFKTPLSDLRSLYGLQVAEMNPWRGVEHHVEEQLDLGRFLTIEVDSWYLPDTAGTAYHHDHVKTTIAPNMIDRDTQRLGYFHNTGYHELNGEDFAGVFRHHLVDQPEVLLPYVELIRTEALHRADSEELLTQAIGLVRMHLSRRPVDNPILALRKRIEADSDWLCAGDIDLFHLYAFSTLRQLGAAAELTASLCTWLTQRGESVASAAEHFLAVSATAKSLQFKLARLMAGRTTDLSPLFEAMEGQREQGLSVLADRYGE